MTYELNSKELANYQYKYDKNGNITEIKADGEVIAKYTYDRLNQLIVATDRQQGVKFFYHYDNAGNIDYVTYQYLDLRYDDDYLIGKPFDNEYTYSDSSWGDLLTKYKSSDITYDEIGNPLNYRDRMTMTWQNGRELASIKNGL